MKHQQWPLLFDSSWGGRGEGGNPGRAGNPTGINGWHQQEPGEDPGAGSSWLRMRGFTRHKGKKKEEKERMLT